MFVARIHIYIQTWNAHSLAPFVQNKEKGTKVTIEGIVVEDPDRRDTTLHATVEVHSMNEQHANGTLIAFFAPDTVLAYGDEVRAKGTLRIPDEFQTDSGVVFDYPHYLQVRGVSAMLTSAKLVSATTSSPSLFALLYGLKHTFGSSLERIFVPPYGALIEGILLGERHGISADLMNVFIVSSLVHIVVLSGHVLTLVADAIMRALGFLPKRGKYPVGALMIVLFVLMVGASSTAIRAGIMALIGLLARFYNRRNSALRTLCIASIAMVFWNPVIALWDTSFILSVIATFGLIAYSSAIETWFYWLPEKFEIRAIAASTTAVQIYILPALLHYTGNLSFLALPANLLALPVLPWAMLFGFIAGMLGLVPGVVGLVLAFIPAYIAQLLLRWIVCVATTIAHVPYAATTVTVFPLWLMLLCYVPLTLVASWLLLRNVPQPQTN